MEVLNCATLSFTAAATFAVALLPTTEREELMNDNCRVPQHRTSAYELAHHTALSTKRRNASDESTTSAPPPPKPDAESIRAIHRGVE